MTVRRLAAVLAPLLLAAAPLRAACPPDGRMEVRGSVRDPSGMPVPCCLVNVATDQGGAFETSTRTRSDGSYSACLPCDPAGPPTYTVSAQSGCCLASATSQTLDGCIDPGTGLPRIVDLGPISCFEPAVTNALLLTGNVACRNAPFLDPVADCSILIEDSARQHVQTWTDARGDWEACAACDWAAPGFFGSVTAQCCGETKFLDLLDCPVTHSVDQFVCDPCPVPPCAMPRDIEITGLVTCVLRPGDVPVPVPDCDVMVTVVPDCGGGNRIMARTDSTGRYTLCTSCPSGESCATFVVAAQSLCCSAVVPSQSFEGCPPRISLPDLACSSATGTSCDAGGTCGPGETLARGRVTCDIDGDGLPDPWPDCVVVLQPNCPGGAPAVTTITDALGFYSACVQCAGCDSITATATCCGLSVTTGGTLACGTTDMPQIDCTGCAVPACPPSEGVVQGTVRCDVDTDGDGLLDPVAGCPVRIQPDCPGGAPAVVVDTDSAGFYRACVSCVGCTSITSTAECCGATATSGPPDCTVPTVLDLGCTGCGPPPNPCAPAGRELFGVVTCSRPGVTDPMAGCTIEIRCIGSSAPPVTAVTAADGSWSACFPCSGSCTAIVVTATCCGVSRTISPVGCDRDQVDLDCGACAPPRPCPGPPDGVEVRGFVACAGSGRPSPLGGCPIELTATDGTVTMPAVTAVSNGDGSYVACVPCPPGGLLTIAAEAACCTGGSVTTFGGGCPERATLQDIACGDCSPCPPGMTRLEGRVHCRGGGGVAGCPVIIAVETCGGLEILTTVTDSEGRYRACVPCACPGRGTIRVTSGCCPATRVVEPGACKPVTPVPTLFCSAPCR